MGEKRDVREIKKVLSATLELALCCIDVFKDGVQFDDFVTIAERLKEDERYLNAFKSLKEVPAEVKDLDLNEGVELSTVLLGYIPKFIASFNDKE